MATICRDFLPADLAPLLAASAFDGSVAVEAHSSEAETDFLLRMADQNSLIRGVVGWVDITAPDLDNRLLRWRGARALKGFRYSAQTEPNDFLDRPAIIRGVSRLGAHDYTFDILIFPPMLAAAERLVSACPGVRFVLDHCAKPYIARGEIDDWRHDVERLARHPNVACKVSGLVTEAAWTTWSFGDLEPYIDTVLGAFGAERAMFGSDWPVCLVAADYPVVVDVVSRFADRLSPGERASLFGGTAAAVYKLEERHGT